MSEPARLGLLAAGLHFVPTLLWGLITKDALDFLRKRRPPGAFPWVLLSLAGSVTVGYAATTLAFLLPIHLHPEGRMLRGFFLVALDGTLVVAAPLFRHLVLLWLVHGWVPGTAWLAVNYGAAALTGSVVVLAHFGVVSLSARVLWVLLNAYFGVMAVLALRDMWRLAGRGAWRPGGLSQARSADVAMIGVGIGCLVLVDVVALASGTPSVLLLAGGVDSPAEFAAAALNAAAGLAFAIPLVVRNLGDLLPGFLTAVTMTAAVGGGGVAVRVLHARLADAALHRLVDAAAVAVLVFVLMPARPCLRAAVARAVFRRGRLRWREIQASLHALSPDLGTVECCRRALAEAARVMGLRGAAILLHDGTAIVEGAVSLDRVARVWPRDGAGLPARTFGEIQFRVLPPALAEALVAAEIVAVVPIASPRRRWGDAFVSTDLRGASFGDEDDAAVDAFAAQLALLLDGAELLARAVAVERSLAHAEKLAAIGETAARLAHDIRNPITAARSLAQQIAREPASPVNAEPAGLILAELDRVERQVASLLRFARRDELRLAAVDVGELVRGAVDACRPRLEAAGVDLAVDAPGGVIVRADGEKMRQVLLNLIDNALDAMTTGACGRRLLAVAVARENGAATVRVTDGGPGIPTDALPHLFEPFFSRKAHGTGLGLAIARRTVEAHGGRIAASSEAGGGATFRLELPLVRGGAP